jgi:hypothetical protein
MDAAISSDKLIPRERGIPPPLVIAMRRRPRARPSRPVSPLAPFHRKRGDELLIRVK